jgi:repressor LexA
MFVESGDVFALRVRGESMVQAGILDGDYVIIRRQDTVEDGEIAAVIINGEGTLKRWRSQSSSGHGKGTGRDDGKKRICLQPANERFDPIEITEDDAKDVLIFGKYVGLVRGNLRLV